MAPAQSHLTARTIKGLLWIFSGTATQGVLQLAVLVILARLLTPEDYGLVNAALIVVGFSTVLSQLGVSATIIQRPILEMRHIRVAFTLSGLLGIAVFLIVYATAPLLATSLHLEKMTPVLRALSPCFILYGLAIVGEALLQREMRFRTLATVELLSYVMGFGIGGTTLALLGLGPYALVGAYLGQTCLRTIGVVLLSRHHLGPSLERKALQDLAALGTGFTLDRIANYIANQSDNVIVGRWLGAQALGVYSRAYQFLLMPTVLIGQVAERVLFPAMAKVSGEPDRLATAYQRSVALVALATLPASAVLLVVAPEFVRVLLGPRWSAVVAPFQVLVAGLLFRNSFKMSVALARATGAVYQCAWRQMVYALLVVLGAIVGRSWGVAGVAGGVLVALAINFLLMAQLSLRITRLTWGRFLEAHLAGVVLAILVGGAVWGTGLLCRLLTPSPVLLLLASVTVAMALIGFLWRRWPDRFLGADGRWILRTLADNDPRRLGVLLRYAKVA